LKQELTEQEEKEIQEYVKDHGTKEYKIPMGANSENDLEWLIECLQGAHKEIYAHKDLVEDSTYVRIEEEPVEWEDYSEDVVNVYYSLYQDSEELYEKMKKNKLESKQRRYDEYLKLKGEFDEEER